MSFQLVGEVVIDGRKGTIALKEIQREATRTSETFKRAGGSTERLGKSLLSLGLNAGRAGTSLGALSRLGAGGLFGAAILGSINKFGETIKQASTDYYESQKALAGAFETSFKSTSVEQAQQGLEKTEDTIESLRGKITQLGALGGFLKGLEKFTGINLGVGDTEKALKDAQNNLITLEGIVAARIKERDVLKGTESSIKALERISAINKIDVKSATLKGNALDENVLLAEEELRTLDTTTIALQNQLKELEAITGAKKNQEAIDKTLDMLADNRVKKAQLEYNLVKAQKDQEAKTFKQAQQAGGGLLGATRAGQQALDNARKVRSTRNKIEDSFTEEKVLEITRKAQNIKRKAEGLPPLSQQDIRVRMAEQQAAAEAPSLAEKLVSGQTGKPAEQIAAERAGGRGGADLQGQLLKAIQELTKKLPAAVAQ
jgi:hypothetical protein